MSAVPDPLASDTEQETIENKIRRLAHWEPSDTLQQLRTRLACIAAAFSDSPAPLASSSEPQVMFSTTTVDGPSTAAPGMPTIGGSSVPVRASGEPQK